MRINEQNMQEIAEAGALCVLRAALDYLRNHNLEATDEALAAAVKVRCKEGLDEALRDAKEAVEANMTQMALGTFGATMALAGIRAAKDAGRPADRKETE